MELIRNLLNLNNRNFGSIEKFRLVENRHFFPQKENFVKCDWPDTNFLSEKNFEVENVQLLTMIFSGNFLSMEIFLEWKWDLTTPELQSRPVQSTVTTCGH
jgi:hypothetical protein